MVVHAALIGFLIRPHARPKAVVEDAPSKDAAVKFIRGNAGKQPPRSDAASVHPDRPHGAKPPPPRKATPQPKEVPVESAPQVTSTAMAVADEPDEPVEGTGEIGEIGESAGGPGEGAGKGAPGLGTGSGPIVFEHQSMAPPQRLSGPDPRYTQEALEHEIEGVMEVRCIVGLDGRVSDCNALRSLPFMDREVIEALQRRRYLPATQGGRAIAVEYVFHIELRLP